MMRALAASGALLVFLALPGSTPRAQPAEPANGRTELGLVLRQLNNAGTFMSAVAHPDDEFNGLLALLSHGQGVRTTLVSATRGDGGQNEIGPELFEALAVLRTEELEAAHRIDGAEQFFTRAVDFGYSFSPEETFEAWGREMILDDFVRLIRTIRPDVIVAMSPDGEGGGQHHQASANIVREAYEAAADSSRFPEQLADGLRPWQPKKFYFRDGFPTFRFAGGFGRTGVGPGGPPGFGGSAASTGRVSIDLSPFDPLLGRTYAEIGSHARGMHKCQGMSPLVSLPGPASVRFRLDATVIPGHAEREDRSLFDGVDTSIAGLARHAGPEPPPALVEALAGLARHAATALQVYERGAAEAQRVTLLAGLGAVRALRDDLDTFGLSDEAAFEIDFRLARKEAQYERAVVLAHGLRLEVFADDGVVTPGQGITVMAQVANHGGDRATVARVRFQGFDAAESTCGTGALAPGAVYRCETPLSLPAAAAATDIYWERLPDAARYRFDDDVPFGAPFRPTPYRAAFELDFGTATVTVERPVTFRYSSDPFAGEKRMELHVVPPFAVEVAPEIAIAPVGAAVPREVRVTVRNGGVGGASGVVMLDLPDGWRQTPDRIPVAFTREDEARTVRFAVEPAPDAAAGDYRIGARFESGGERFDRGYQVVEYPHVARRHLVHAAEAAIKVLDVRLDPDLLVGYVDGVGDEVPPAIEQLGARLEYISGDELRFGDLSRYDVIVTGVRAYERNLVLRANNDRLLEYVEAGGTMVVQYNKFEFNDAQYGPYPALVSRNRVTDEYAPVRVLAPDHPVFGYPNAISDATWSDWVQERGLYFLGDRDGAYTDLVELSDTFPFNPGDKRGALVEARYGEGRWLYVGLGLWRQLPAGTPGAYQLLANLLSLGGEAAAE